jgi:hypothetical protein
MKDLHALVRDADRVVTFWKEAGIPRGDVERAANPASS